MASKKNKGDRDPSGDKKAHFIPVNLVEDQSEIRGMEELEKDEDEALEMYITDKGGAGSNQESTVANGLALAGETKIDAALLKWYCTKYPSITDSPDEAFLLITTASPLIKTLKHLRGASEAFWDKIDPEVGTALRATFVGDKTGNTNKRLNMEMSGLQVIPDEDLEHEYKRRKRARVDTQYFASDYMFYRNNTRFVISQKSKPGMLNYNEARKIFSEAVSSHDFDRFKTIFLSVMKDLGGDNDLDSPFKLEPIWWAKETQHTAGLLAKRILLLEKGELHCNCILVGLKGVGKTTLAKYTGIVASLLSSKIVTVYVDIKDNSVTPLEYLQNALVVAGLIGVGEVKNIQEVMELMVLQNLRLLFILDEAQDYYVAYQPDLPNNDLLVEQAKHIIGQLYALGNSKNCMVILCGSSSKLPILTLRHEASVCARDLLKWYPSYHSLNNSKFVPISLNALKWNEMGDLLSQFLNWSPERIKEHAMTLWLNSGGTFRYLRSGHELPTKLPMKGPELLVLEFLLAQQPRGARDDISLLESIPINVYTDALRNWIEYDIADVKPNLVYELVDQQFVSVEFDDGGEVKALGFSHPAQFRQLLRQHSLAGNLTTEECKMIMDPKTYGVHLEMFAEECIAKKRLQRYVLCLRDMPSNMNEHVDILLKDWDPLGKHKAIDVLRIFPDDFGVDVLKIMSVTPLDKPTRKERSAVVVIEKHQFKLGGSNMSPGDNNTKDTANHAVHRAKASNVIDKVVKEKFCSQQIDTTMVFYVTRKLSDPVKKIFLKAGKLIDREGMFNSVWDIRVTEYAQQTSVSWIIPK